VVQNVANHFATGRWGELMLGSAHAGRLEPRSQLGFLLGQMRQSVKGTSSTRQTV
jgi:hypothetical protein